MIVPVQLGCCPDEPRCLLCPPPDPDSPEVVEALLHRYVADQAGPGDTVQVRFFGGPPPDDARLDRIGGRPFSVRVRPDLLSRADARRLADRGCVAVELDVLTFDRAALAAAGRRYRRRLVDEMSEGLPRLGLEVGGVLAPGLPATTYDTALADAHHAVALGWSTVRLHPVLVLDRSRLRQMHEEKRYTPLSVGEAVTVCRGMMDVLEPGGVEVVRVGLQPGPDGFGRAVAGPEVSNFRQLVESRRTLDRAREALAGVPEGAVVTLACAPADETRTRGPRNSHIRTLRAEHGLADLHIETDPALERTCLTIRVEPTP